MRMDEYKISTVMSTDVLSVAPHSSLIEITQRMSEQQYSCLLVVQDKKPIGIITERDIVKFLFQNLSDAAANLKEKSLPVAADLMTYNLIMLQEEQSILEALVICLANKVRHLPIINSDGELSGLVTYTDIANFQRDIMETQSAIIEKNISERTLELVEANRRLKEMTLLDPLLGIGNRRAMEIDIKCTHDLSKRYIDNYAIAMVDIDNFKLYNDYYGHQAGDIALQKVTNSIKSTIRSSDRVYRYGGEELLILLPQTTTDGAKDLAERVLSELELENIPHDKSPHECVTVSCGLGMYNGKLKKKDLDWAHVIKYADEALYVAKNCGRNQVSINNIN